MLPPQTEVNQMKAPTIMDWPSLSHYGLCYAAIQAALVSGSIRRQFFCAAQVTCPSQP